jgi:hypothetical protein
VWCAAWQPSGAPAERGAKRSLRPGERALEAGHLLGRAAPQGAVLGDVGAEVRVLGQGREDLGPSHVTAAAAAEPPEPGAAQQRLHRADLGALQAHEVPPARQALAQAAHRGGWDMNDRAVRVAPQALAELEGVASVTLSGAGGAPSAGPRAHRRPPG